MLCKPKSFGRDIGVDLCRCSVAVFEDVVLVVQVGEFGFVHYQQQRLSTSLGGKGEAEPP
jgi:hypothetical protein